LCFALLDGKVLICWHVIVLILIEGDDMWLVAVAGWTCLQCSMWVWGMYVEMPHTGSCSFTQSIQYKSTCSVEDVDFGLGEGDRATGITKLSHAKKVVGESVHDVAIVSAWWELW
jgi:hypothetical protein